jgi:hypothetical protein
MKSYILKRYYKIDDEWLKVNENDKYINNPYYNLVKLNMMHLKNLLDPEWYNNDEKFSNVAIYIGYVELSLKLLKDEKFKNIMLSKPILKPNEK